MKTITTILLLLSVSLAGAAETRDLLTASEKAVYDSSARDSDALVKALATRASEASSQLAPALARIAQLEAQIVQLNAEIAELKARPPAGDPNPALVAENVRLKDENAKLRAVITWHESSWWRRGPKPPMP